MAETDHALSKEDKRHDADERSIEQRSTTSDSEKEHSQGTAVASAAKSMPSYPGPLRQTILVAALMLAMFIVSLDGSIIATAIPTITADFHSTNDVGWYGSAFFIGLAMFQGFWGKAYKIFGQKSVFLSCIFIFEIGSIVVATAPNSPAVITGRAIQGLGGAGVTSGVYLIVAFIVPVTRLSVVMGLFGVVWACSSIVGPLLGGVLTQDLSWRWCFWINLPIGGAAFIVVCFFFKTPDHAKLGKTTLSWKDWPHEFDFLGIVLGLGSWICLLLVLQDGGITYAWNSGFSIGLLIAFWLLVIAFILAEWRQGDTAMFPTRLLKDRTVAACAAYNFLSSSGMLVRTFTLPLFFQAVQGVSPSSSGIRTLPSVLATSVATFASATALGKVGYYLPFLWVGGILNTIGSGIYYLLSPSSSAGKWIGFQIIVGVGAGIVIQIPVMVAQRISRPQDMSMTVGIIMCMRMLLAALVVHGSSIVVTQFVGGGFGVSIGEAIVNNRLIDTLPASIPSTKVLAAGATGLREAFPDAQDLTAVVRSYMIGLRDAWIFSTTMIGVSLIVLFAAEWRSIKKQPASPNERRGDMRPTDESEVDAAPGDSTVH